MNETKKRRMIMWIDQILKNLDSITDRLEHGDFKQIKKEIGEQYRMIMLLHDIDSGRTRLEGFK